MDSILRSGRIRAGSLTRDTFRYLQSFLYNVLIPVTTVWGPHTSIKLRMDYFSVLIVYQNQHLKEKEILISVDVGIGWRVLFLVKSASGGLTEALADTGNEALGLLLVIHLLLVH